MTKLRVYLAILTLAVVLMFAALVGPSRAARADLGKDLRPEVAKISEMFKGGKADDAAKASIKTAKAFEDTSELMHLFRARNKGGIGWGAKSITTNPTEDGLEKKLQLLADPKKPLANVAKEAAAAEEAAYDLAAMAELVKAKAPAKNGAGGKTIKAWQDWSDDMRKASLDLAKAAAAKDGPGMAKAAAKVNSTCNACHSKFKD